jgi:hypothetical protein
VAARDADAGNHQSRRAGQSATQYLTTTQFRS